MSELYHDPEWLYQQLEVEERTQIDIGEEFGITNTAISHWVRKFRENGEWPPDEDGDILPGGLVFTLEVGDKVDIGLVDEDGWAAPFNVIDAPAPVVWEAPFGEDFETRRLTLRQSKGNPQRDLYAAPAPVGLRITGTTGVRDPVKTVDRLEHVGTVSPPKLLQLQAEADMNDDGDDAVADGGDNSWRRYYEAGGEQPAFDEIETPDWLDEGSFYSAVDMADDVDELVEALGWDERGRVIQMVERLGVWDRLGGENA